MYFKKTVYSKLTTNILVHEYVGYLLIFFFDLFLRSSRAVFQNILCCLWLLILHNNIITQRKNDLKDVIHFDLYNEYFNNNLLFKPITKIGAYAIY